MPNAISLSGFKEFEDKLKALPGQIFSEVDGMVEDSAKEWEERAKMAAPVDMGLLRANITTSKARMGTYEVHSNANYSAYIEWGTGKNVKVPADMSSYAAQFRGKGSGDYYDFLNAILDWVKRKGIAAITNSYTGRTSTKKNDLILVAQAIAFSIMKNGIKPRPFFFIQRPFVEKYFIDGLKKIIGRPR